MVTAILTIAGSIIAGVAIPLFGIWLKNYLNQKAADAQAAELAAVVEKQAQANQQAAQGQAATINGEITAEQAAKDKYLAGKNTPSS